MSKKEYHSSIRISESEKAFLDFNRISILNTLRIGIMALGCVAQSDPCHPCIYVHKSGENRTLPADPCGNVETLPAHCCPGCPVRNAMPKRYPTALKSTGQKENMIVQMDQPAAPGSYDLVAMQYENQEQSRSEIVPD
jgi:hypothetical protein